MRPLNPNHQAGETHIEAARTPDVVVRPVVVLSKQITRELTKLASAIKAERGYRFFRRRRHDILMWAFELEPLCAADGRSSNHAKNLRLAPRCVHTCAGLTGNITG